MRQTLVITLLLCCSCSHVTPPTEDDVKRLLAINNPDSSLIRKSSLEGFECHLSEADDADYECEFILAGVYHEHYYVKVDGHWQMVYERGSSSAK
jgi:hypothetical protein